MLAMLGPAKLRPFLACQVTLKLHGPSTRCLVDKYYCRDKEIIDAYIGQLSTSGGSLGVITVPSQGLLDFSEFQEHLKTSEDTL